MEELHVFLNLSPWNQWHFKVLGLGQDDFILVTELLDALRCINSPHSEGLFLRLYDLVHWIANCNTSSFVYSKQAPKQRGRFVEMSQRWIAQAIAAKKERKKRVSKVMTRDKCDVQQSNMNGEIPCQNCRYDAEDLPKGANIFLEENIYCDQ